MSYGPTPPPPWSPHHQPPQHAAEQEKAGFFRAGKVALWVWIVLTLIPIVIILACCGFCGFGSVLGAVTDTPTPTP